MTESPDGCEKAPRQIRDAEVGRLGYTCFKSAAFGSRNRAVEITYHSGASYEIPLDYVLSWYSKGPHEYGEAGTIRVSIPKERDHFALTLDDGSTYFVVWDVVLMACEPLYEHFGGFTDSSRKNTNTWFSRRGPFRK